MENFDARIERIESLVQEIEDGGDSARNAQVRELLQTILEMHGAALTRVLEDVYSECGQGVIDRLAEDELVSSVLLLHDLHPLSRVSRVVSALESVKPYLASHGGNVELVDLSDDGTVVLRLEGSCNGCPSSQATLKYTIEEAIYAAAPDVRTIEMVQYETEDDPTEFIPMEQVQWDDCPFPADDVAMDQTTTNQAKP